MPPTLGQGANQAIQDAASLADRLASFNKGQFGSLNSAISEYESRRKPTVAQLLGKSIVLGVVETLPEPLGPTFRDNFFYALDKLGVAQKVLMDAALPVV